MVGVRRLERSLSILQAVSWHKDISNHLHFQKQRQKTEKKLRRMQNK
jgi:hypothetical protein